MADNYLSSELDKVRMRMFPVCDDDLTLRDPWHEVILEGGVKSHGHLKVLPHGQVHFKYGLWTPVEVEELKRS